MLEPVKLTVDPELKGRKRRLAAGAALYEHHVGPRVPHHLDRPHRGRGA